jgi:hypothetical protein
MPTFCTYQTARRLPAVPMQPLVDPAGWDPDELRDVDRWCYSFSTAEQDEIIEAVAATRRAGVPLADITRETFKLTSLAPLMEDVRRELLDGRGVVRLRDFPVARLSHEDTFYGYLGLGCYLGSIEPQNQHGHLIGHIKNLRNTRTAEDPRGYQSYIGSSFHVDSTDFVGLLCLHEARSGGESRLASSVTVYNRLLAERPDLIEPLMMDFYKSRYGEYLEGEKPYYKTPIFAFVDGYFSALGYSTGFEAAQKIPGVPPLTEKQKEARPVYTRIVEECSIDMPFRQGDVQFLNNYVIVHARHTFTDWPEVERKRYLLRLWLNDAVGRPMPEDRMERRNRSLHLKGIKHAVPLEIDAPVY